MCSLAHGRGRAQADLPPYPDTPAYAMELARKGMSVVLISRSADRLEEASKEIKAKYPKVEVKTIVADFSDTSDALYQSIGAQLQGLDLGVLVRRPPAAHPRPTSPPSARRSTTWASPTSTRST